MTAIEWDALLAAGLRVLQSYDASADEDSLLHQILHTGYPAAPNPHSDIGDLIYTFAASIHNSGSKVQYSAFARMARKAIQHYIDNNTIIEQVDLPDFAQHCLNYLRTPGAMHVGKHGYTFETKLEALVHGYTPEDARWDFYLHSVVDFANLLRGNYGGSALRYQKNFMVRVADPVNLTFLSDALDELMKFDGVGVAVGMNFIKDSQVPAFYRHGVHDGLEKLKAYQIGYFVKPDMHVLRFMLKLTGRSETDLNDAAVMNMPGGEAARAYGASEPASVPPWPEDYTLDRKCKPGDVAAWRCVEDVCLLAQHLDIAPFVLDRLFYLSGSGMYRIVDSNRRRGRYRQMFRVLNMQEHSSNS